MREFYELLARAAESGAGAETADSGAEGSGVPTADPSADPADEGDGLGTPTAEAPAPSKQMISLETFQKRMGAVTGKMREFERQAQSERQARELLEKSLAARQEPQEGEERQAPPPARTGPNGEKLFTEAEVRQMASMEAEIREFNAKCDAVAIAGKKAFGEQAFQKSVQAINSGIGDVSRQFLEAVLETGEVFEGAPAEVMYELGKDLERAEKILSLPPARQGVALAKFAVELERKKAEEKSEDSKVKKISGAPAPITPKVGSGAGKAVQRITDDNLSMDEWMALRNKEVDERRKTRR